MADESRIENILDATLGEPGAEVPSPPFSRIEEKLIELKEAIESGDGDSYTKSETNALLAGKADIIDGKVPAAQLPSYVDDVAEYASTAAFPVIGESGKIYIATNTNKTYRWSGSAYAEISESLALGETASTAYPGNLGKANADAIAKKPGEITTGKRYTIDGKTVTASVGAEALNYSNNKASGMFSHAEGQSTIASGMFSHAEGVGTIASGSGSHAEGGGTTASGGQSHAEGNGTKASSASQHVQGKFNVEDSNDTYAFIIGNGTANNARHNAFSIDWNGLIYVNGSETGVDVSALAPQATTYTKAEVDTLLTGKADLSIFTPMTQAQYDALVTRTAPLYFIYEDGEGS